MHGSQAGWRLAFLALRLFTFLMLLGGLAGCNPAGQSTPLLPSPSLYASPKQAPSPTAVPSPTPDFTAIPVCSPGKVEPVDIPTSHLDRPLHASVYLPPCYSEHTRDRYPVLYLFHGLGDTDQQWVRLGAPAAADRLIAAGVTPPFIIVMPYDPMWREPSQYGFEAAIVGDLLPAIDARYRTLPDRLHRAVGGLSRGSGWAIRLGLSHPDLFGALGAHSVIVFGSDGPLVDNWLAAIPPQSMPRIYMDAGDHDSGLAAARVLEAQFTAAGIPHEWHLNIGYHTEAYWSAHVEDYLRWYAAGW